MTDLRNHPDLHKAPFASGVEVTFGPGLFDQPRPSNDPVTYLMGDEDGTVRLVCEDAGCMVAGPCSARLCFLEIELPYKCSPWQAAGALTAHLREAHRGA